MYGRNKTSVSNLLVIKRAVRIMTRASQFSLLPCIQGILNLYKIQNEFIQNYKFTKGSLNFILI